MDHHHHCCHYLKQMVLSLKSTHHRKFYRANSFSCWMQVSTLISNHGRLNLLPCRKGPVLTSYHGRPNLPPCQKGSALTSDHQSPILPPCWKGPSLPFGGKLDMKNTKLLSEVLKFHSGDFQNRITSGLIMSKDNLRASPGLITFDYNLHDLLRLSNL